MQSQKIAAETGDSFFCYSDPSSPNNQHFITGVPKTVPVSLFFKVSFDALPETPDTPDTPDVPDEPEEPEPESPSISIQGQKYGQYDDADGLGGATITLYQTAGYEKVKPEDGEEKPKVPEYELVQFDEPKKVATTKSRADGSFSFRNLSVGEYFAQELDHATGGGYTLEGERKPVNNYLNPTVFDDEGEVFEFSITMETDPEAKPPYSLLVGGDAVIEMNNYQQYGRITVQKLDRETGNGNQPQGDGTLEGAKFAIIEIEGYGDDGTPYGMVVENLATNERGVATSSELPEGIKIA